MKNEYDALNRACMDLDGLDETPLSGGELDGLRALLTRKGLPLAAPAPRRLPRRLAALSLAAALGACLFTAGAAARFDWGRALSEALGMSQGRAEELGLPGQGLGLTETAGDASVTVEGVIGTGRAYYFPFIVTGPEGSVLGGPEGCSFDEASVLFESGSSACTLRLLPDDDPADNRLCFILEALTDGEAGGGKATLRLRNLFTYPAELGRYHDEDAQVKGEFTFTFRLPQGGGAFTLFEDETGLELGLAAPLTGLRLSPMSLELTLKGSGDGSRSPYDGLNAALCRKDGVKQPLVTPTGGPEAGVRLYGAEGLILCSFSQLADLSEFSGVEINGRFFALPQG